MSSDISIRIEGHAGRITLTRPQALNALSYKMCLAIDAALIDWAEDERVKLLIIDAEGTRAFCAGGDIAEMYETGRAGDFGYGRKFWADEYRMNARLFNFPKPVVSLMQGYTMGGGVGLGCHGSHRIVCENSEMAMPEVGIGLIPDVGGTLVLSRAPGRLGEYLGATARRMPAGDAIYAGFADYFIAQSKWPDLIARLCDTGDWEEVDRAATPPMPSDLESIQDKIDHFFGGETLRDILNGLASDDSDFAVDTIKTLARNSPLAMAATIELIHRVRVRDTIEYALEQEYRFTARAMEKGDFLEGIRAAIIDKDRQPKWKHDSPASVGVAEVAAMLMPLGAEGLRF